MVNVKGYQFTGFIRGELNGKRMYKVFFRFVDKNGFTSTVYMYVDQEAFDKLPRVGEVVE